MCRKTGTPNTALRRRIWSRVLAYSLLGILDILMSLSIEHNYQDTSCRYRRRRSMKCHMSRFLYQYWRLHYRCTVHSLGKLCSRQCRWYRSQKWGHRCLGTRKFGKEGRNGLCSDHRWMFVLRCMCCLKIRDGTSQRWICPLKGRVNSLWCRYWMSHKWKLGGLFKVWLNLPHQGHLCTRMSRLGHGSPFFTNLRSFQFPVWSIYNQWSYH